MRERADNAQWFQVEFLMYLDDRNQCRTFAYVRKEDGSDLPDGHYFFLDELGEQTRRWRKWKGVWQVGWRIRSAKKH